jgi:8-oxo-dGTP diphosphatase
MTIYLVRHAAALSRREWVREDELRPLSPKGEAQAKGLVDVLGDRPIRRILSSPAVRCWATMVPLADELGVDVEHSPELWEGAAVRPARDLLDELPDDTVLCSHGDLIPDLLNALIGEGLEAIGRDCKKGSTWALDRDGGRFLRGHYLPPPEV